MTNREKIILTLAAVFILGVLVSLNLNFEEVQGSAPMGMSTQAATSSTITANTSTALVAFATSSDCTSRVITTAAGPASAGIRINFADLAGISLSQTVGHFQAASTTVVYDAGLYGCGQMTVFGVGNTNAMQVTEFRGFR